LTSKKWSLIGDTGKGKKGQKRAKKGKKVHFLPDFADFETIWDSRIYATFQLFALKLPFFAHFCPFSGFWGVLRFSAKKAYGEHCFFRFSDLALFRAKSAHFWSQNLKGFLTSFFCPKFTGNSVMLKKDLFFTGFWDLLGSMNHFSTNENGNGMKLNELFFN
jgi:hypothetical protein